jgi:hypothetical protein
MKLSASAKEAVTDVQSKSRKKRPRSRLWPSGSRTRQDRGTEQPDVCQRRTYDHAIREFVACYCSEPRLAFHRTVVLRYRIQHGVIADLVGKDGHVRTVPIPNWVKSKLDAWMAAAAIYAPPQLLPPNERSEHAVYHEETRRRITS